MRIDILERKEEILQWIAEELPLCEIKTRLRCKHETLRTYLKQMGIEYAGQQNKKGQHKGGFDYRDSSYYTYKGAPRIQSAKLREKLIRDGIKENKCEKCGNTHWLGKKLPLELHHKDGDHFNNELSNLEILCPNCHAVEAPNAGAAIGSYTKTELKLKAKQEREKAKKLKDSNTISKRKEYLQLKEQNPEKVDSFGRLNLAILTEEDWLTRKNLIINSDVDLMKFGWKTELQKVTGLTRRQVDLTIAHFNDYFIDKVYIRN
jgi:5-methylcytosine-specific restriction endonuclease McrA